MQPDEIIVVMRRDDHDTPTVINKRREERLRSVVVDLAAGQPGFVTALNAGIGASHGTIVCFTDDDAEPRADWLSRIVATFEETPAIGAVGGRDWIYADDGLREGAQPVVGTVSRRGKVVGGHHLGVGCARDVAILKGVNMSVRGELVREIRFDTRLRGTTTEHHAEMGLCLTLIRMGYRVVYDPHIAVDHRPQPRVAETRQFGQRQVRDAAHNETLALLEHLHPLGALVYLVSATVIGSRAAPGVVQAARLLLTTGSPQLGLLAGNLAGRALAVQTYLRWSRRQAPQIGGRQRHTWRRMPEAYRSSSKRTETPRQ
jgi:cellulose synthase/poly-beta-1,6-N-acetylglucosamine synthase-like glycosyltransferase